VTLRTRTLHLARGLVLAFAGLGCASAVVADQPGQPYDPPAGVYPLFPASPFLTRVPNPATVNPQSAIWLAKLGNFSLGRFQFAADASGLGHDYGFPLYYNHAGANVPVKIHCTRHWGTCNVEGLTVYIDPHEVPQDNARAGQDSHLGLIDQNVGDGYEYTFWQVGPASGEGSWPPSDGTLHISWGGRCLLSGNGFTNPSFTARPSACSGTATSTPLSSGAIRVKDLLAAVQSGGTLPFALAVGVKCSAHTFLPPFRGSDGHDPTCSPQGSRMYLAMHDADVDATGAAPIVRAILRTIDEDHYGMFVTDTNGGQDGVSLATEADTTYTSWGAPGPWLTQFVPEAQREGLPGAAAPYNGTYHISLPLPGNVAGQMRFL